MSDWWSSRLGGAPAATQPPPGAPQQYTQYSPVAQPQTFVGRDGQTYQMVPVGQQQPQNPYAVQPAGAGLQPALVAQQQGGVKVTMHNLIDAVAHWQGGEGAKALHRCPGCGSAALYERGYNMAPQCYECGWNPRIPVQGQPRG